MEMGGVLHPSTMESFNLFGKYNDTLLQRQYQLEYGTDTNGSNRTRLQAGQE
jgi:hypothetical protein